MGKLIKNHWARLVMLVAASIEIGGSIEGFIWPKATLDFSTSIFNVLVKPYPVLQIINLVLGVIVLAWEWPVMFLGGTKFHRSIPARLVVYAICAVTSLFLYQAHSATLYYVMGLYGYGIALAEKEASHKSPERWSKRLTTFNRRSIRNLGRFFHPTNSLLLASHPSTLKRGFKNSYLTIRTAALQKTSILSVSMILSRLRTSLYIMSD